MLKTRGSISFLLLAVLSLPLVSQPVVFQETIKSSYSGAGIVQTNSGYIVVGRLSSSTFDLGGIFGLNAGGNFLWGKKQTGVSTIRTELPSVIQPASGGYVIGGTIKVNTPALLNQVMLIKIDSAGITKWARHYGSTANENGYDMKPASDGGFILAGQTAGFGGGTNLYMVKTDSTGQALWERAYGETPDIGGVLVANAIIEMQTGGFLAAGYASGFWDNTGNNSAYILRTDAMGNVLWYKSYAVDSSAINKIQGAAQTNDGSLIFTGYTNSLKANGGNDVFLMKTDSLGNMLWSKVYGGTGNEMANKVEQTNDGGFVFGGYTTSFKDSGSVNQDYYLLKADNLGNLEWSRTYSAISTGSLPEAIVSISKTSDGGYAIAGGTYNTSFSYSGAYIVKTDSLGHTGAGGICTEKTPATVVKTISTFSTTPSTSMNTSVISGAGTSSVLTIFSGTSYTVTPFPIVQPGASLSNTSICTGDSISLYSGSNGSSQNTYQWTPSTSLSNSTTASVQASPTATITYKVLVSNLFCSDSAEADITVDTLVPNLQITAGPIILCIGESMVISASGGAIYAWSPTEGLSATDNPVVFATPTVSTLYNLVVRNIVCEAYDSVYIEVQYPPLVTANSDVSVCKGNSVQLTAGGGSIYTWVPSTGLDSPKSPNPKSNPENTTSYTVTAIQGVCSANAGVTVTVLELTVAAFTYTNDSNRIIFTNTSTAAGACNWNFGDNVYSSQFDPAPHIYPSDTGTYMVTLIVSNTCNSDTASQTILLKDLGMDEYLFGEKDVLVYPNPGVEMIHVIVTDYTLRSVKLTDAAGRIVFADHRPKQPGGRYQCVLDDLPKGYYLLTVSSANTTVTKKVIVF